MRKLNALNEELIELKKPKKNKTRQTSTRPPASTAAPPPSSTAAPLPASTAAPPIPSVAGVDITSSSQLECRDLEILYGHSHHTYQ